MILVSPHTLISNENLRLIRDVSLIATPQALTLRLDLHPPSSSPQSLAHLARYLIIEGVSPVSLPLLEPGESHEQRISICLLAQGRYEFGCVVEDRGVKGKRWEAGERVVLEV